MSAQPSELMKIQKPISSKAKFIDFEIEREQWNKHRLADKSLLKSRFVLLAVLVDKSREEIRKEARELKPNEHLKIGFGFKGQRLYSIEVPSNLREAPDSKMYSLEELRASTVKKDIDFETAKATWNSYKLRNGMSFKCRLSPTLIDRTNKYDNSGMPIYIIDSNLDVKVTLPSEIEKILEKKRAIEKKS